MFKRILGVAVLSAFLGLGLNAVTQPSVSPLVLRPVGSVCSANCLRVEPVGVTKFGQLTKSNDIQPATNTGRDVLQHTESPQKELGE